MPQEDVVWHAIASSEVMRMLNSQRTGLSSTESEFRLREHGSNELEEKQARSPMQIFIDQFKNILIILLVIAAFVSLAVGEIIDGALILAIVMMNGVFGFVQEYKAEKNIEELKKLSKPKTRVVRDGVEKDVPSATVVPGDIMLLEEGDSVTADARIIEQFSLRVDESSLTGESMPVSKRAVELAASTPLAERSNMLYLGTSVVGGRCTALVTGTGMLTELGGIARELQQISEEQTPFQKKLDELGKKIAFGVVVICVIVAGFGVAFGGASLFDMMLIAIALGVAAIPEGLPAVITLSLALGTKSMLRRNALVRRLPVAEGLGSVDVICSDKTGTMTENIMTVRKIYFNGLVYEVSGSGYELSGEFVRAGSAVDPKDLSLILEAGFLNNNSRFVGSLDRPDFIGDPTEIALKVSAMKAGVQEGDFNDGRRVDEIAFSSERKMMTTVHEHSGGRVVYTKGAPELVLGLCDRVYENGAVLEMSPRRAERILEANRDFASRALRVIGFAYKDDENPTGGLESKMVFIGLQAMIDPPRKDVKRAVSDCYGAGIRVVMITGDNRHTAEAVAREVGIDSAVMEGREIDLMSAAELSAAVEKVSIYARVSPKNKLDILNALKRRGHVVAMTGDGVNDAPALKSADVGVAMGIRGTDVAKETSDIILLDDNFATIRDAIEEGRRIFDNIRKFVMYLLSCNLSEVIIVFFAGLPFVTGKPLIPLTAVMLLWINIVTDGLPALALGVDPATPGILRRKPRPKTEGVINGRMVSWILFNGFVLSVLTLSVFYLSDPSANLQRSQTIAFTTIVLSELVLIPIMKSRERVGLLSNRFLIASVGVSLALQFALLYGPFHMYFKVTPLGLADWVLVIYGLAAFSIVALLYHNLLYSKGRRG